MFRCKYDLLHRLRCAARWFHRFRNLERRRARAHGSDLLLGRMAGDRVREPTGADTMAQYRDRLSTNRSDIIASARLARGEGQSNLADAGGGAAANYRGEPLCQGDRPCTAGVSLCDHVGILALSAAVDTRGRDLVALAPGTDPRGRALLVELLAQLVPDGDSVADRLLGRFGTVSRILASDPQSLQALGLDRATVSHISLMRELLRHALRAPLAERPLVNDLSLVVDYLVNEIGHAPVETLHVLFMDSGNRLIDEMIDIGDIDSVHVGIRGIVQRALIVGAAGIILAHNHPSGENRASKADRDVTRALARAVSGLGISLFDHLIISGREVRSLRAEGVL